MKLQNQMPPKPNMESMIKAVNYALIVLLMVRPLFAPLKEEGHLLDVHGKAITLLSLWSILFFLVSLFRALLEKRYPERLHWLMGALLVYMAAVGVTRLVLSTAFVVDYLYTLQLFAAVYAVPVLVKDFGIRRIAVLMTLSASILLLLHFVYPAFSDAPFSSDMNNYVGGFSTKQAPSMLFYFLLPFPLYLLLKEKDYRAGIVLAGLLFALFFTYYRTFIVSAVVLLFTAPFFIDWRRLWLPAAAAGAAAVLLLLFGNLDAFISEKITTELAVAAGGDVGTLGAGRLNIIMTGIETYLHEFSFAQQVFGGGTGYSYLIHKEAVGYISQAHVQAVAVLLDYGAVGALLYAVMLWSWGARLWSDYRDGKTVYCAVAIGLFAAFLLGHAFSMTLLIGGNAAFFAAWFGDSRESGEVA